MKYKLQPLYLCYLTHPEMVALMKRQLTEVEALGNDKPVDAQLEKYLDDIDAQHLLLEKGLYQVTQSSETKRLVKADAQRVLAVRAVRQALRLASMSDLPDECEAARILKGVLKSHGPVERLNYESKSMAIELLCAQFTGNDCARYTGLLAMQRYVTRLQTANLAFDAIFERRSKKYIEKETFDNRQARKQLTDTYQLVTAYIQAMANAEKPGFDRLLSAINLGRKYYMDLISRRRGHSKKMKEQDQEVGVN